jgi:uncharacterized protein
MGLCPGGLPALGGCVLFNIYELETRKVQFDTAFQPGEIDFTIEEVRQAGPLTTSGTAELLPHTLGEIRVTGHLTVTLEGSCDRCLERAAYPIDSDFDLYYRPADTGPEAEEIGIDEGEAEIAFYEGEGLVLEDILREFVLLALPMQRVCREDCKGICPVCGTHRNNVDCDCHLTMSDDRWAALKKLKSS